MKFCFFHTDYSKNKYILTKFAENIDISYKQYIIEMTKRCAKCMASCNF